MKKVNNNFEVIIVGGGPAGSTAGYLLSKIGLKVLLIDKEKFPRKKLCGGLVSIRTLDFIERIFKESYSSLKNKGVINYIADHCEIYVKNKMVVNEGKLETPFIFVDRAVYDNFFLNKAKNIGLNVIEGEEVSKVDFITNEVILSSGKRFKSEFIIGADGAHSIVLKNFFNKGLIDEQKWRKGQASVVEGFIYREKLNIEDTSKFDHPSLYFGFINEGYSYVFPYEDQIYVGIGGNLLKNKGTLMKSFQKFLKYLNFENGDCYGIKGAVSPLGTFDVTHVYEDKIMLIGDAGGFIDPFSGEGIFSAHQTAEYATIAIVEKIRKGKKINYTFESLLRQNLYNEFKLARLIKKFAFSSFSLSTNFFFFEKIMKHVGVKTIEQILGVRKYNPFKKPLDVKEILNR